MTSNLTRIPWLAAAVSLAAMGIGAWSCATTEAASPGSPAGSGATDASIDASSSGGAGGSSGTGAAGSGGLMIESGVGDSPGCERACSTDLHSVVDCTGKLVETCSGTSGCDLEQKKCVDACSAAINNRQSVGCEYYATFMDNLTVQGPCFAAFVANTWNVPAHLSVEFNGQVLPVSSFARIPKGSGASLTYEPFDAAAGLSVGEVAILFLSGPTGKTSPANAPCPVPSAVPIGVMLQGKSGIGKSFRIQSDVPVVAYQMNPYGGGSAAVTGASLLLPTSTWDTNYVAINAYSQDTTYAGAPSLNVVASEDNTQLTLLPVAAVDVALPSIPATPANTPLKLTLNRGDHLQLSQPAELTGSIVQADKPVGFMAGHQCMYVPNTVLYCDHGEQMIPPVKALGSEYVGVMYRPRKSEPAVWRVFGTVDGTTLGWSSNVGGPTTLARGQMVEFQTSTPFVVKSQDDDHPFILMAYMSGSAWKPGMDGYGDADSVLIVPPKQFMPSYVFFTDPTYPETNLVIVRSKANGKFEDVTLSCKGVLDGWTAVGEYEWTRVDLVTANFQGSGNCSNGRHTITSKGLFGVWVWGWGTPMTGDTDAGVFTKNVSYGFPAGMNVQPINQVVIPPVPH